MNRSERRRKVRTIAKELLRKKYTKERLPKLTRKDRKELACREAKTRVGG